ncbi:hypothetical protein J116_010515 [Streptomyces thermolilacinus SPC6]|uniref:Uncharacterized protein n=1 Tax=Streptomyces thermolilacinus SPC6 TaxID=1306406 RepID=A0A1D3DRB4_9ACTN|nr:hypothetical protein J116_010515 [Streptomyces thermolilacinus SPC6]
MRGEALLGPEGEPPHPRVEAVGAHDQVEVLYRPGREPDPHRPAAALPQCGDGVPVHPLDPVPGPVLEQPHEVVAHQLDVVAVEPPAAGGVLGAAVDLVAFGVQHGHAAHPRAHGAGGPSRSMRSSTSRATPGTSTAWPPSRGAAARSTTVGAKPYRRSQWASAEPAMPPPETSTFSMETPWVYEVSALNVRRKPTLTPICASTEKPRDPTPQQPLY